MAPVGQWRSIGNGGASVIRRFSKESLVNGKPSRLQCLGFEEIRIHSSDRRGRLTLCLRLSKKSPLPRETTGSAVGYFRWGGVALKDYFADCQPVIGDRGDAALLVSSVCFSDHPDSRLFADPNGIFC